MVRRHLSHPRRVVFNPSNMESSGLSRTELDISRFTRTSQDNTGFARPDSMARILLNSSKPNTAASVKSETSVATITRRILPNVANSVGSNLPICEIKMTSKLKSLLLEGHRREQVSISTRTSVDFCTKKARPFYFCTLLKQSSVFDTIITKLTSGGGRAPNDAAPAPTRSSPASPVSTVKTVEQFHVRNFRLFDKEFRNVDRGNDKERNGMFQFGRWERIGTPGRGCHCYGSTRRRFL